MGGFFSEEKTTSPLWDKPINQLSVVANTYNRMMPGLTRGDVDVYHTQLGNFNGYNIERIHTLDHSTGTITPIFVVSSGNFEDVVFADDMKDLIDKGFYEFSYADFIRATLISDLPSGTKETDKILHDLSTNGNYNYMSHDFTLVKPTGESEGSDVTKLAGQDLDRLMLLPLAGIIESIESDSNFNTSYDTIAQFDTLITGLEHGFDTHTKELLVDRYDGLKGMMNKSVDSLFGNNTRIAYMNELLSDKNAPAIFEAIKAAEVAYKKQNPYLSNASLYDITKKIRSDIELESHNYVSTVDAADPVSKTESSKSILTTLGTLYESMTDSIPGGKKVPASLFVLLLSAAATPGCTDKGTIDSLADGYLDDMSGGEHKDTAKTIDDAMHFRVEKVADEKTGYPLYTPVMQAATSIPLDDADNAIDLIGSLSGMGGFGIIKHSDGTIEIVGDQELDGWQVKRSLERFEDEEVLPFDETPLNDKVFGNVKPTKVNCDFKGNPSANEMTAMLTKTEDGRRLAYVLFSPSWLDEDTQLKRYVPALGHDIIIPWGVNIGSDDVSNTRVSHVGASTRDIPDMSCIDAAGIQIPFYVVDLTHLEETGRNRVRILPYVSDATIGCFGDNLPGIVIENSSGLN